MTFINKLYSRYIAHTLQRADKDLKAVFPVFLKGNKHISVGEDVLLDRGTRIEAWDSFEGKKYRPKITIGNHVYFNPDCHIGAIHKITLGNNVLLGAGVLITDHSHGRITAEDLKLPPRKRRLYSKGPVSIADNVWLGEHTAVLPGVKIGRNAIIGANSVVTRDIPANAVAAGIPAKVIQIIDK